MKSQVSKIGFGGGCHWCTEAVFQSLQGVTEVQQGWIASFDDQYAFSEAVIVFYNQLDISLEKLIEIHLLTHSSTSDHSMRKKYRSAIYSFTEEQSNQSKSIISKFQKDCNDRIITKVYPFKSFKPSPADIQNYYEKNPLKPFCIKYIDPKLKIIRDHFDNQQ